MSFTNYLNIEEHFKSSAQVDLNETEKAAVLEYISELKRKSNMEQVPFVFFYEDVIGKTLNYDYKNPLGEPDYKKAEHDALQCLSICNNFNKITDKQIDNWLGKALKFADHIVLNFIQVLSNTKPQKCVGFGIEKSRYIQLQKMDNKDMSVAASHLKELYDLRNRIEHRTIEKDDGTQEIIKPPYNQIRRSCRKYYPDVLERFLKTYKTMQPNL